MALNPTYSRWTRSPDGLIAGVCKGVAEALDLEVWLVRLVWVLSIFLLGFGVLLYIALAFSLPRSDKLEQAYDDKILGVCAQIAERSDIEVGVVRMLALVSIYLSAGATVLAYIVLYFVFPEGQKKIKTQKSGSSGW
ncbi:MAG: PspC domain-containing protein [Bdellovibrionales bacterium]|nr:PspC domain-containing protein [Bdellovibrionales bacterium]